MNDWLDDLSEDWPSQPPSLAASQTSKQLGSSTSRIPRLSSVKSRPGKEQKPRGSHNATLNQSARRKTVLTERTSSQENAMTNTSHDSNSRRKTSSRSFSAESAHSPAMYCTVEKKAVTPSPKKGLPNKAEATDETPEWRRRLLMGEKGYGDQTDLFGPSGIESLFQKPRNDDQSQKPRGLSFLKGLETIPSSPPWPPTGMQSFATSDQDDSESVGRLDPVDEIDEQSQLEGSVIISPRARRGEEAAGELPTVRDDDDVFTDGASLSSLRPLTRKGQHSAAFANSLTKRSRQSSAQTQSSCDSFSAVFIGKHTTADGRIAYQPLDMPRSELAEQLARLGMRNASQSVRQSVSSRRERLSESPVKSDDLPTDLPVGTPDMVSIGEFVTTRRGGLSDDGSFMRRPLSPSPLKMSESELRHQHFAREERGHSLFHEQQSQPYNSSRESSNPSNAETILKQTASITSSQTTSAEHDISLADSRSLGERKVSTASQFGQGDLDDHEFPEEFSSLIDSIDKDDLPSRSPSPDVFPPGFQRPFKFHVESASDMDCNDTFKNKRKLSKVSARSTLSVAKRNSAKRGLKPPSAEDPDDTRESIQAFDCADGKRPPPSPFKHPTPKRRRTFLEPDMHVDPPRDASPAVLQSHERIQSALGKRKDARQGSFMFRAEADVLSGRRMLRPRNPTPNQRRHDLHQVELRVQEELEDIISSSPRLQSIQQHLQVPLSPNATAETVQAHLVANEVAAFSERIANGIRDDTRKRSVTTQDFLDEAMKIMSFIRNKGRPGSGLENLQESHLEAEEDAKYSQEQKELFDPPTGLTLSRPPSREGSEGKWRPRQHQERRPSVVGHLDKYRETEEEDFMAASIGSKLRQRVTSQVYALESDPPGIQIIRSSPHHGSHTTTEGHDSSRTHESGRSGHTSHPSVDSSLGRTTASRKSETVATVPVEAVAHLIPEEIAGMVFNRDTGKWEKMKSPRKQSQTTQPDQSLPSEISDVLTSEDDPFGNIPDLTFDENEEAVRLSRPLNGSGIDRSTFKERLLQQHRENDEQSPRESLLQNSQNEQQTPPSSVVSQFPRETPEILQNQIPFVPKEAEVEKPGTSHSAESVELEIKINEGRDYQEHFSGKRSITVTVPVSVHPGDVSISTTDFAQKHFTPQRTSSQRNHAHDQRLGTIPQLPHMRVTAPSVSTLQSSPLPMVDEGQELSFLETAPSQRHVNFSLSLRNPPTGPRNAVVEQSSPARGSELSFYMSELSDFTIHQADERKTLARPAAKHSTKPLEDRFAWGNHLLVKALQDNEPEEPYWEDLTAVNLSGKGITSLHLLDELCCRLEKADLSGNEIDQLTGAPPSLRCLDLHQNNLTGLSWWGHLTNLQYLDVSNNNIDSLTGFSSLIHLRELKAENNKIASLDPLHALDGLLKLSLRGNEISGTVDFDGFELTRLECLDLGENQITSLQGLQWLPALRELILDCNKLSNFPCDLSEPHHSIEYLDLSSNELSAICFDKNWSSLKCLNVDHNSLSGATIDLSGIKCLSTLSLRAQSLQGDEFTLPSHLPDITTINLSLNTLHTLPLTSCKTSFLGLQNLELANCGLASLPENFGLAAPNLRAVNLNFNALKDLRPLLNIKRLTSLFAAGNRLSRLRKTMAVLAKLSHLEVLDLRGNPFTLGYHEPPSSNAASLALPASLANATSASITAIANTSANSSLLNRLQSLPLHLAWNTSSDTDIAYLGRLDDDTRLRRRVYEMLLASGCKHLRYLDGFLFSSADAMVRDAVWERLVALGVLMKKEKGQ